MAMEVKGTVNGKPASWRVGGGKNAEEAIAHILRIVPAAKALTASEAIDQEVEMRLADSKEIADAEKARK